MDKLELIKKVKEEVELLIKDNKKDKNKLLKKIKKEILVWLDKSEFRENYAKNIVSMVFDKYIKR